ncbi:MAG TPA: hypothetical protein VK574_16480 [Terracidiphilus sp.]|nr:hypothetical protein [Terracidiphilus sp.]
MRSARATALFFIAVLQISLFIPAAPAQSAPAKNGRPRPAPAPPAELNSGDVPMEIWFFDRLAEDDEIAYVNELMQAVYAAAKGDQVARAHQFFMNKQPGESISGMGQFELKIAQTRIKDMELAAKNPKAPRARVDDVMDSVLEQNGLVFTPRPVVRNFQRKSANLRAPLTLAGAQKELADVRAYVDRNVGTPTDAELENPPDATWTDRLDFEEPRIMRALYTGDFTFVQHYRSQVLTYIGAMDQYLRSRCPKFDGRITDQAATENGLRYQLHLPTDMPAGNPLGQRPSGNPLDLGRQIRQAAEDNDDGNKDGEILYTHAPFKCDSGIVVKIHKNMEAFVGLR